MEDYDASEHRKTMYAHFGAAFYLMNCFEAGLADALLFADFMTRQKESLGKSVAKKFDRVKYESDFDAFVEQQFAQTMGNLLRRLEKVLSLPAELQSKITEAKKRRDFLTHHFFRERAEAVLTPSGLNNMIEELESDQNLFKYVDRELQNVLVPVRKNLGINDEWLEAKFQEMLAQISSK